MTNVLVLDCGSSSVKFQVSETDTERIAGNADRRPARGAIERVGGEAREMMRLASMV